MFTAVDPELLLAFSEPNPNRPAGKTTRMLWDAIATDSKGCNFVVGASYSHAKQLCGVMCDLLDMMEIPYDVSYGNRVSLRDEPIMWTFTTYESINRAPNGLRKKSCFYDHYVFDRQRERARSFSPEVSDFLQSPKTYGVTNA